MECYTKVHTVSTLEGLVLWLSLPKGCFILFPLELSTAAFHTVHLTTFLWNLTELHFNK